VHSGNGYDWETTFVDVTPVSYAQMGLLPQVHRYEVDVYANIRCLLEASARNVPPLTSCALSVSAAQVTLTTMTMSDEVTSQIG
jgi:hypothetical protein